MVVCDGRVLLRNAELVQPSARQALASANERRDRIVHRARLAGTWSD
jgi:hypothetical protein